VEELRTKARRTLSNTCTNGEYKGSWEPLCCNENWNLVNTLSQGLGRDLYWPPSVPTRSEANLESLLGPRGHYNEGCSSTFAEKGLFGVPAKQDPWSQWPSVLYGLKDSVAQSSNIVFSNGLLDPWSSAGVFAKNGPEPGSGATVQNITVDGSVIALILDLGAHHLDLFFSDPNDPQCATEARAIEEAHIQHWLENFDQR